MSFVDDALILAARPHGETHAVVELLTPHHGRWPGLVYGGQGRKQTPLLQPGNSVKAEWKGRGDSLGFFALELTEARAATHLDDRLALAALSSVCSVTAATLPEREPHPRLYHTMKILLAHLGDVDLWPALMARFELGLLAELGFGLSLDRCAATGARDNLIYVSPKSGAAVSAAAGEPYKDRLLPLPAVLKGEADAVSRAEAAAALKTTGYFIETRILHQANRELPEARKRLLDLLSARPALAPAPNSDIPPSP